MTILKSFCGTEHYHVDGVVVVCGLDLNVCICGGDKPHIGASALGIPRPSLQDKSKGSASVSVLTATGHKEDELVRFAAHRLSSRFGCHVSVCAGIHMDHAQEEDIKELQKNFMKVLEELEEQICQVIGKEEI